MDKLNVAVIGCGCWGKNHARIYNDLDAAELVAVSDHKEETACDLGGRYGADYGDFGALLKRGDVEMVSLCTPTVTHANIALAVMEAGKPVRL